MGNFRENLIIVQKKAGDRVMELWWIFWYVTGSTLAFSTSGIKLLVQVSWWIIKLLVQVSWWIWWTACMYHVQVD